MYKCVFRASRRHVVGTVAILYAATSENGWDEYKTDKIELYERSDWLS